MSAAAPADIRPFTMSPPMRPPSEPCDDVESRLRAAHSGQRVLLAEDNPVSREVGEELLGLVGLTVESAVDGHAAVALALDRHFDLVLMDVQMPGLDGLEAVRLIRARLGPSIPIIALTANAFAEDQAECKRAGMNDHITKPIHPTTLYSTLLRWLPPRSSTEIAAAPAVRAPRHGPVDASTLLERLAQIEGLDVDAALLNFGGQATLLLRVMRRFVTTYRAGLPALLDATGTEYDAVLAWRGACHSVRAALTAIGATQLTDEVTALELELQDLGSRSGFIAQGVKVHEALLALVGRLSKALQP